jgi:hypothetical protein
MNFAGPVDLTNGHVADTMVVGLYRSPKILSGSTSGWMCCGAHGWSWIETLAIDPETGRDVRRDLVEIAPLADFCWQQFSKLTGPIDDQGKQFSTEYPRKKFHRLMSPVRWHVTEGGLNLEFGYLLGYVGAGFRCTVENRDLSRFTKPGVAVPF